MKLCLRSSVLRLLRYHHQLWERHKLLPSGDGSDHFSALNASLRHDVKRALYASTLHEIPMFEMLHSHNPGLLPHMIDRIVPRYFNRWDRIIARDSLPDGMYIVSLGLAGVARPTNSAVTPTGRVALDWVYRKGEMFGEVALVLRGKRRRNVIALTWTRLLFLSLSDWDELVAAFPAMLASLRAHIDENHYDVAEPDKRVNHTAALDDAFESAPHDETEPTEPMPPSEDARLTLG